MEKRMLWIVGMLLLVQLSVTGCQSNHMPQAIVGKVINTSPGVSVVLHGEDSYDQDGDNLQYCWTLVYSPAGSQAEQTLAGMKPNFTPDKEGVYVLSLIVRDKAKQSLPAYQFVNVEKSFTQLDFKLVDVAYDIALDKIVMVSTSPNRLHIYDPTTRQDVQIELPDTPVAIALNQNGLYAAVGCQYGLVYVNVGTGEYMRSWAFDKDIVDVMLGDNGYAYILFEQQIAWINLETGEVNLKKEARINDASGGAIRPDGKALYIHDGYCITRFDLTNVVPGNSTRISDIHYFIKNMLWFTRDGQRLITNHACLLPAFDSADEVENCTQLDSTDAESITNVGDLFALISVERNDFTDTQLVFRTLPWRVNKIIDLPVINFRERTYLLHGRAVFANSAGDEYYVVMVASDEPQLANRCYVVTYQSPAE